jgi:signal transduction histidine kinase
MLQQRLQGSLQLPVWNLDSDSLLETLRAELGEEARSIQVLDVTDHKIAEVGDASDGVGLIQFSFPLNYTQAGKSKLLGSVLVNWSNELDQKTLSAQVWRRAVEILVVDCSLLVALWISLELLIFRRLTALNDALLRLAYERDSSVVLTLDTGRQDEFDAIAKGINLITQRLTDDLQARRHAEIDARDALTNLQEAKSILVQSEKMAALGSLVAGVAHELNTPIGNALMMASLQHDSTKEFAKNSRSTQLRRSDLDRYCEDMLEASELLMRNINSAAELIRNFKQVAVDRTSANRRDFDLKHVVEEVLGTLHHMTKNKSIEVVCEIEEGLVMDSYPGPLGQVITNLFVNALIHGIGDRPHGRIFIGATKFGQNAVTLEFSDDGRGIAQEHLDKVFNPFFTTKLGQGGSGLGLSIVHNLVTDLLSGHITVANRPEGGSIFRIYMAIKAPVRP